jgi:hypothetical protein
MVKFWVEYLQHRYKNIMIDRILKVFNKNLPLESRSDIWDLCYDYSSKVEITEANLENMANTNLCFGFFGGTQEVNTDKSTEDRATKTIIRLLESLLGFKIDLPQFIGGRRVLMTPEGIITDRHLHYLWILKRIIELCPDRNNGIIEIGAGLGLLGYFLDKAGYKDYTSIDLAYPGVCQSYFLHKNLPERNIILSGEKKNPFDDKDSLKLLHSTDFINMPKDRFIIMINIDSLPEMISDEAIKYISSDCASLLLSINQEDNIKVSDLCKPYRSLIYREQFHLRDGYFEELYRL